MPNFDPAQELPEDSTIQTVPVSLPNQFGAVVAGTPSNPDISPHGNPADQVINPAAIVDPALRAQYIASQTPAVLPVTPASAPLQVTAPPVAAAPVTSVDPTMGFTAAAPAPGPRTGGNASIDRAITDASAEQQKAITAEGAAQADAATAEAEARKQGAAQVADQQRQLKEQQVQRDAALRQLNQDSSDALEKAHSTTVPSFWEGKPGQAVTAAILVGLGAVGQGLTAFGTGINIGNNAQNTINHAVDTFAEKKRDEINNLYKYAAAKNQLSQEQKLEWATKLNEVQYDLAATHQSIQDHLAEVAAQGRGKIDQAHYASLAADNKIRTQQLLEAAQMNRAQINHLRNEDAIGFMNAGTAKAKAMQEGSEKADEAAFRTYAMAPHGDEAKTLRLRLSNINSALEDIKHGKSEGEVTKALEAVIAADTGKGTRGVSQGQLHTIIPNLVSKEGQISQAVSQGWNGKAGKEYREAVTRLAQSVLDNRTREYKTNADDLERGIALTPHGQKNKDFAKTARAQLYPDLAPAAPTTRTVVPKTGQYAGKTVTIDGNNNILSVQ